MRAPIIILVILATLALLCVGTCFMLPRVMFRPIYQKQAELTSAAVVQSVGPDLAQLCQTCLQHPDWFPDDDTFAPVWLPPALLKFQPTYARLTPDGAHVEFGGGFYHYGYRLDPQLSPAESGAPVTWIFYLYREDADNQELARYTLTPDDALTEAQFVDRIMAECDQRIAAGRPATQYAGAASLTSVRRCEFAIKHNQIPRLQQAIRNTAQQHPNAWLDVLLAYVIDFPIDPDGAAARLRQWATDKDDFSAWLLAAYAFDKVGQIDAAVDAVQQACTFPADDPPWAAWHARVRGYPMCWRLFLGGHYEPCLSLCDRLLAYTDAGDHLLASIQAIRDACQSSQASGTPTTLPTPEPGDRCDFDPFADIDIRALQATPAQQP